MHLNEICSDECSLSTLECIQNCDVTDTMCISSCLREESTCIENCPCGSECPDGCDDQCENSVCQCSDFDLNQDWSSCIDANSLRLVYKIKLIMFIWRVKIKNIQSLGRCIYNCQNDLNCEAICVSHFKTKQNDCPCEENCKTGCPCDSYECDFSTTTTDEVTTTEIPKEKAVLVLNTNIANNTPMTIDFQGKTNTDINLEFEEETSVGYGCSAALNGEFLVFGGLENEQQVRFNTLIFISIERFPFVN